MQNTATFPNAFSQIPQALQTVAVRCTTQLLNISADPVNTDPDLFGKLQRNLNGILRSLALVEKHLPQPAAKPRQKPPQPQPQSPVETVDAAEPESPGKPAQTEIPTPPPQVPLVTPSAINPLPPAPTAPPTPERRPSKAQRRAQKRAEKKERRKQYKLAMQAKRVQTSEQNSAAFQACIPRRFCP